MDQGVQKSSAGCFFPQVTFHVAMFMGRVLSV
jgi:hypothetical protein